jgi:hypothetical protein
MVAFASLDEAFDGSHLTSTIENTKKPRKKAQQQDQPLHPTPPPYDGRRNHHNSDSRRQQQQKMAKGRGKRERRDATGDDSDSLKPLSNDLLPKGTISSFSRGGYDDAAKYTSFDRGSDTDDVENVMDMYTSSSNGGGGSVCRRKGGHARANKKDNADDPTTSDYVQPSDDMNTGSSFADSSIFLIISFP